MGPVKSLDDLAARVLGRGKRPRVAIARCADGYVLRAGVEAFDRGLAEPVLIGNRAMTADKAACLGLDISRFEFIEAEDDLTAVRLAVDLFRQGGAALIMKGAVSTAALLKAVLDKERGIPTRGILSHVAVFDAPHRGGLMFLTDAGVNIRPNLQRKAEILRNALDVARRMGVERPRAAMLAATEKVNFPAMPATLDADLVAKMAEAGEFGDALVAGPLALDVAVSPEAAACKGVSHPVAGRADVLCVPDIESGNVLYKALTVFAGVSMAGVVVGSDAPLVVPSRGDSELSKFYSMCLGVYLCPEAA